MNFASYVIKMVDGLHFYKLFGRRVDNTNGPFKAITYVYLRAEVSRCGTNGKKKSSKTDTICCCSNIFQACSLLIHTEFVIYIFYILCILTFFHMYIHTHADGIYQLMLISVSLYHKTIIAYVCSAYSSDDNSTVIIFIHPSEIVSDSEIFTSISKTGILLSFVILRVNAWGPVRSKAAMACCGQPWPHLAFLASRV